MKIKVKNNTSLNLLGLLLCARIELNKLPIEKKTSRHDVLLIEINLAVHELLQLEPGTIL
jgi:hypothetical protein